MKTLEQSFETSGVDATNQATSLMQPAMQPARQPALGALGSLRFHWPEYLMEAALLGGFMVSACAFGALYEFLRSPVRELISSQLARRILMGLSMGATAIVAIYSPWGKQSGAHMNPSISITFFRLGKIKFWDVVFYSLAQFGGAAIGVLVMAQFLRKQISDPSVRYVVTVPGTAGPGIALLAELLISGGMMTLVLYCSNHRRLNRYTGLLAGLLVATYISIEAPLSGMSMNPARSFGSAIPSGIWTAYWLYLIAPPLGMLAATELYLLAKTRSAVGCAKLHHANEKRCIFCGANGGFAS
jgi:aquaporin Z